MVSAKKHRRAGRKTRESGKEEKDRAHQLPDADNARGDEGSDRPREKRKKGES